MRCPIGFSAGPTLLFAASNHLALKRFSFRRVHKISPAEVSSSASKYNIPARRSPQESVVEASPARCRASRKCRQMLNPLRADCAGVELCHISSPFCRDRYWPFPLQPFHSLHLRKLRQPRFNPIPLQLLLPSRMPETVPSMAPSPTPQAL